MLGLLRREATHRAQICKGTGTNAETAGSPVKLWRALSFLALHSLSWWGFVGTPKFQRPGWKHAKIQHSSLQEILNVAVELVASGNANLRHGAAILNAILLLQPLMLSLVNAVKLVP